MAVALHVLYINLGLRKRKDPKSDETNNATVYQYQYIRPEAQFVLKSFTVSAVKQT